MDLRLESVHRFALPVRQLVGFLPGLLLSDAQVDHLVVAGVLLDGSLLQLVTGGLHHDGVHGGLVGVVVCPVDELRGLPDLLVPQNKRLRALGVGVEELEHGTRPVAYLLEGVLDLVHGLLVGIRLEHLPHVLEQVRHLISALHHQHVLLLLVVPVHLQPCQRVEASGEPEDLLHLVQVVP